MKTRLMEEMTETELRIFCNNVASAVLQSAKDQGVEHLLFALVMFNDPKVGQYVCNCERSTMMEALTETVRRIKNQEDVRRDR